MGLTNPGRALGRSFLLSISRKLSTLSGIPPFSINSFRLASLLALLVGLHLSFLIDVLAWFIKGKKVAPFESVEVFRKDLFLAQCFSLYSSMIFLFLCLLLDVALAHLDSLLPHDLVLWTDGSVPSLGKGSSIVLANCFLCGTKSTLSFSAGPLCSSFSAEVCAILHALCWSRQYQQVCHFLLSSYYLTLVLSSPPCPLLHLSSYLKLCGKSGMNCLLSPPVVSDYNGSSDTRFSRGTTRLMSWPDGECYLHPLQSLVVSLLLSLVSTLVFSRTGGILSHRSILTHRFPRFPLRNSCSLVMLAVFSLVYPATNTAYF